MKLTKEERLAVGEAFKAAKKYLYSGKGDMGPKHRNHICYSLVLAQNYNMNLADAAFTAMDIVSSRLGKSSTVTSWLNKQKEVNPDDMTTKNIQAYRHRWLDALIEEFSK